MAGLSRTKAAAGGISVPIGSALGLLDTASTVSRGGETFLKNGQLSNTSTYPNAPTRNFMGAGTLTTQSYPGELSPWGGLATITMNKQGVAGDDTDGNFYRWVVTNDGYIHRLSSSNQANAVWDKRRNLRDGTVFSTSCTASEIHVLFNNSQNSDLTASNTVNSKTNMLMVCAGNDNNTTKVAYLSGDLDTHYGTFTISFDGSYAGQENRNQIACCIKDNSYFLIGTGNTSHLYMWQYVHPSGTSGTLSSNDNGYLHYSNNFQTFWQFAPEFVPYHTWNSYAGYQAYLGIKTVVGGSSNRIAYFPITSMLGSGGSHGTSVSHHTNFNPGTHGTWRSPAKNRSGGGLVYHRVGQTAPYAARYDTSATVTTWPSAYSSTGYTGYTQESSSKVWVGVGGENKIIRLHPTTYGSQATISTSSQQAPKQLAWYNNLVFNFAADSKVYRYNSTNNAYVGVTDATSYISAGNGAGIAIDSATGDLYLLDKSNSRIHKYNSSLVYQSYVTLSDSPHSTLTLAALSFNTTNDVFYVYNTTDNNIKMYALNGTYNEAFVAGTASTTDADYHDSHIVTMNASAATTTKTSQHDVVGNPIDGTGAQVSQYTRVG